MLPHGYLKQPLPKSPKSSQIAYPPGSQSYTENTQQFEEEDSNDYVTAEEGVFAKLVNIANVPFHSLHLGPNKLSYSIGRKLHNDIQIKKAYISGTHCVIEKNVSKNLVTIRDKSSNGTFVNGINLRGGTRILHHHDVIAISPAARQISRTPNAQKSRDQQNANTPSNARGHGQPHVDPIQFSILIPEKLRPNVENSSSDAQDSLFFSKYKYDETKSIGEGSFGNVYKCVNKSNGELFAVKVMNLDKLRSYNQDVSVLRDEANLMLKIKNHPNIVQLHDAYFSNKHVRLVMDLMDGGDLFEHVIKKGVYSEADGKKLINNILQGLQFAHAKNIAHRDLKPENILISSTDRTFCKIADWGAAKRATATRKFKTYTGTENYLAPEVFDRKNTVKHQGK